jgi:DNA-binding NtrC family response regulator
VFRAVVLAETDEIGVAEFPQIAAQAGHGPAVVGHPPAVVGHQQVVAGHQQVVAVGDSSPPPGQPLSPSQAALPEHPEPGRIAPHSTAFPTPALPLLDALGQVRTLEEIESEVIRFAISHYRGQMSEVARRLQIGRSTLYRKLEALGLNNEPSAAGPDSVVGG